MANNWNFTAPITTPNIQKVKITRVSELDEDAKRMVLELQVIGGTGVIFPPNPWRLEVTNGAMDGLAAHPAPALGSEIVISIRLGGAGVATAFDTLLTAYRAAGGDKRGNLLTAMAAISGTVAADGGPLAGQAKPAIPAGTLS
jgi:hypothetical protein